MPNTLPIRGYLIHMTHYDPVWVERKAQEKPFDLEVGLEIVETLADIGFNMLIVACSDGVQYAGHPELARHYTVPMSDLETLVTRARACGLEIVPKLNFSQSAVHQHNHWFRPHHDLFDTDEYWQKGFEVIDEIIGVCKPERFFHIGMDEDHQRSYSQYAKAICTLHDGLAQRGLRTIIWNDSECDWPAADIHKEKSLFAEERIPTDVVELLWNYWDIRSQALPRLRDRGFEVWLAPGGDAEHAKGWRQALLERDGAGMVVTHWTPCIQENRQQLLDRITTLGPIICTE
ncbi:MAG: hypothetical protein ACYDBB_09910 [Armatimonadota bacterium]